jgi:hypothetical protein
VQEPLGDRWEESEDGKEVEPANGMVLQIHFEHYLELEPSAEGHEDE